MQGIGYSLEINSRLHIRSMILPTRMSVLRICREQNSAMSPRYTVHPVHIRSMTSMSSRYTVHPVHIRSMTSMSSRYTVHPVHIRSMTSMSSRYTVHPVHKAAGH